MRTRTLVVVAVVATGVTWWAVTRDAATARRPLESAAVHAPEPTPNATPAQPAARAGDPLPASLRDSEVDGELIVDAKGHFVPSTRALALFDYFLSASGEEPALQLRARIVAEIERRLPDPAAGEASAFLDRYLAYRAEGARAAADDRLAESADLERRLQWIRELRRARFGAELAETLFGDEERAAALALERRRIVGDASLTESEKRARLDALEAERPEPESRALAARSAPLRLQQQEQALRARGGDTAALRALREQMVGAEAAARLEERDQRRAEWEARLVAYRIARDAIRADASLDPQTREAAIEDALARRFDARERIRVRTLDSIELGATPEAETAPAVR